MIYIDLYWFMVWILWYTYIRQDAVYIPMCFTLMEYDFVCLMEYDATCYCYNPNSYQYII